jgi:hypothetical protein
MKNLSNKIAIVFNAPGIIAGAVAKCFLCTLIM